MNTDTQEHPQTDEATQAVADTSAQALPETQTVMLDTVEDFARVVINWHQHRMNLLGHLCAVPDGTEMEFNGKVIVLSGDLREAFLAGLTTAKEEFEVLPFQRVEADAASAVEATASTHDGQLV